jgi:hypothetical protein
MAMLAPVHVENFGRLYGSNQPISAHFTAFNSSDQLQRKRSSIFQKALANIKLVAKENDFCACDIIAVFDFDCDHDFFKRSQIKQYLGDPSLRPKGPSNA